jgi:hypothetical protein
MPDQARRYNGRKRSIASGESYFYKSGVAIEDANRTKYNTARNSSMGSFIDGHPLQTQGTAMF